MGLHIHKYILRLQNERLEGSTVKRDLEFLFDGKVNESLECALAAKGANLYTGVNQA